MELSSENQRVGVRGTTALRARYEAEAKILADRLGGLEGIRQRLGMSRRQICQFLLIDPSAWSRWTKSGGVPPMVFRTLELYLALKEKLPDLATRYYQAPAILDAAIKNTEKHHEQTIAALQAEMKQLRTELARAKKMFLGVSAVSIGLFALWRILT